MCRDLRLRRCAACGFLEYLIESPLSNVDQESPDVVTCRAIGTYCMSQSFILPTCSFISTECKCMSTVDKSNQLYWWFSDIWLSLMSLFDNILFYLTLIKLVLISWTRHGIYYRSSFIVLYCIFKILHYLHPCLLSSILLHLCLCFTCLLLISNLCVIQTCKDAPLTILTQPPFCSYIMLMEIIANGG